METKCFGLCTGPSSALTCAGGNYTVCFYNQGGSLQLQLYLVVLRYSLVS